MVYKVHRYWNYTFFPGLILAILLLYPVMFQANQMSCDSAIELSPI